MAMATAALPEAALGYQKGDAVIRRETQGRLRSRAFGTEETPAKEAGLGRAREEKTLRKRVRSPHPEMCAEGPPPPDEGRRWWCRGPENAQGGHKARSWH